MADSFQDRTGCDIDTLTKRIDACADAKELTQLYVERAHCYELRGESVKSVNDFLTALDTAEDKTDMVRIKSMLALALVRKGEKAQAMFWAVSAVDQNISSAEANFVLGLVCDSCEYLNIAIEFLRKAIELQPQHWQAICVLGTCLRENAQIGESIEILSRYVANNPNDPVGLYELAWSLQLGARSEDQLHISKRYYESALRCSPDVELRDRIERKLRDIRDVLKTVLPENSV